MQDPKTVGSRLRPDWQHLSPWRAAAHGTFPFQNQQKAGPGSYPCTNGMRGDPTSSLAVGAAAGTTITGCTSTHQGKILKTSFLPLTNPLICPYQNFCWFMSTAEDSQTRTPLHKAWKPWKFKSWYGLTSVLKTFKSTANNYHTLKSQIKYFVELKHIYIWLERLLNAGKISLQFLDNRMLWF